MKIAVTAISAYGTEEIAVSLTIGDDAGIHEQKERFVLSVAQIADLAVSVGECDEEQYDRISHAAAVHEAERRALRILAYGSCSEKMLIRKLMAKSVDKELAVETAAYVCSLGVLNPMSDAAREAERAAAKHWGKKRIIAALFEKGYSDNAVKAALAHLEDQGIDYADNCAALIAQKYGEVPASPDERRKLYAALMRYGYSSGEIREAFSRHLS